MTRSPSPRRMAAGNVLEALQEEAQNQNVVSTPTRRGRRRSVTRSPSPPKIVQPNLDVVQEEPEPETGEPVSKTRRKSASQSPSPKKAAQPSLQAVPEEPTDKIDEEIKKAEEQKMDVTEKIEETVQSVEKIEETPAKIDEAPKAVVEPVQIVHKSPAKVQEPVQIEEDVEMVEEKVEKVEIFLLMNLHLALNASCFKFIFGEM